MTAYLKVLAERAIVTFAATLGSILTAGATDLLNAPWEQSLSAAGLAALLTVLASVAGGKFTSSDSPAFTSKETEVSAER